MGSFLNQLSSPIGVKLFKGGPYADAGAGDKMQGNLQQYMAQIAPLIAQIAQNAGVTNPQTGQGPSTPMAGGTAAGDPYGLTALDQGEVNRQAGVDQQTYQKILNSVKADLSARGMTDSSVMTAAESYLKSQLSTQMGSERLLAGQNALQNRQNALGQIAQLLSGQYGAQQQVTQQQGATAEKARADSMTQLGSLLGIFGGNTNMFGMGPKTAQPAGYNPAAGGVGEFGTPLQYGPLSPATMNGIGQGFASIYG